MQTEGKQPVDSIDELTPDLPQLLERVNSDPRLALAAAVNPLLFLDEMGYALGPNVAAEIEERSRFSKTQIARRRKAIAQINKIAEETADLSSATGINEILARLGVEGLVPDVTAPPGAPGILNFSEELLKKNWDRHPVFNPLLDLRRVEASGRSFAPERAYRDVRSGKVALPGWKLKARLSPKPKERRPTRGRDRDA
jgi:hypothetical protein